MKNEKLFNKTISILVKAYFNETLEYSDCKCCAVGNLVADAIGSPLYKKGIFIKQDGEWSGGWSNLIDLGQGKLKPEEYTSHYRTKTVNKLLSTGYSLIELAAIEKAFFVGVNKNLFGNSVNYDGLMCVVDTLMQIHEATAEETESAKLQFVR